MRQRNNRIELTEREEETINFASRIISYLIIIPLVIIIEVFLGTYLWGCIAVAIFGLPALTKCQFFGLMVLIAILFGKFNISSGDK